MSLSIVAMSGGERTKAFNTAVELTGDEHPSVLIIPTACSTSASYDKKVPLTIDRFTSMGLTARVLHEYGEFPSDEHLAHELGHAALLYTIGGNTPYLLDQLDTHDATQPISDTIKGGAVHAGTSAGALLPFEIAHSNIAQRPVEQEWDYAFLRALGLIEGVATVHANAHDPTPLGPRPDTRMQALAANFPDEAQNGYAIDNGASLIISGGAAHAIRETPGATVHLLRRSLSNSVEAEQLI